MEHFSPKHPKFRISSLIEHFDINTYFQDSLQKWSVFGLNTQNPGFSSKTEHFCLKHPKFWIFFINGASWLKDSKFKILSETEHFSPKHQKFRIYVINGAFWLKHPKFRIFVINGVFLTYTPKIQNFHQNCSISDLNIQNSGFSS